MQQIQLNKALGYSSDGIVTKQGQAHEVIEVDDAVAAGLIAEGSAREPGAPSPDEIEAAKAATAAKAAAAAKAAKSEDDEALAAARAAAAQATRDREAREAADAEKARHPDLPTGKPKAPPKAGAKASPVRKTARH